MMYDGYAPDLLVEEGIFEEAVKTVGTGPASLLLYYQQVYFTCPVEYVNDRYMAEYAGLTTRTIRKYKAALREAGFIQYMIAVDDDGNKIMGANDKYKFAVGIKHPEDTVDVAEQEVINE